MDELSDYHILNEDFSETGQGGFPSSNALSSSMDFQSRESDLESSEEENEDEEYNQEEEEEESNTLANSQRQSLPSSAPNSRNSGNGIRKPSNRVDPSKLGVGYQRGAFSIINLRNKELVKSISKCLDTLQEASLTLVQAEFQELAPISEQRQDQLNDCESDPSLSNAKINQIDKVFKNLLIETASFRTIEKSISNTNQWADSNVLPIMNDDGDLNYVEAVETKFDDIYKSNKAAFDAMNQSTLLEEHTLPDGETLLFRYENFRRAIFEGYEDHLDHQLQMPAIEQYLDDAAGADDDDDLVVERERVSYKCPLTKTWLVEAMTSKRCGHSFSREAIFGVLPSNNRPSKCPVPACGHTISRKDLVSNSQLQQRANRERAREIRLREQQMADLDKV